MFIKEKSLDDLLRKVFEKTMKSKTLVSATRGDSRELSGVLLQLSHPEARLSRSESKGTVFSCLGELLWYLDGSKDLEFISYYIPLYEDDSEDDETIYGGYGPRFFNTRGNNQIDNIINLLKKKDTTRRAVIQLFDASDLAVPHKDIPCTCTLQFLIRDKRLHMFTNMRSNDVYFGLPHDIFSFTMLQEIIARTLNVKLGKYKHFVGSLHLYTKHVKNAEQFLKEGWQENIPMPLMPPSNPWTSIKSVLDAEKIIRSGKSIDVNSLALSPYWEDLVRLLQIFRYLKNNDLKSVVKVKRSMSSDIFENYIHKKVKKKIEKPRSEEQMDISGLDTK